jgi:tetratricopeptide (TPR) repeat protein
VFALFALLAVNSLYLAGITFAEWLSDRVYQDYYYQVMFLVHLVLGLVIILPAVVFGILHLRRAWRRPNRNAVRAGLGLYATVLVLIISGLVLTRFDFFSVRDPDVRTVAYWVHVVSPLAVIWLFVLHRLAGAPLRWRTSAPWAALAGVAALALVTVYVVSPRPWGGAGPMAAEKFFPSLARTARGDYLPASSLMRDRYCKECHRDSHERWSHSVHRFSSFNNPAYAFSVAETRRVALRRDGDMDAARFCAGCHDPVPLFSGIFDDPDLDLAGPEAQAGITCVACHAITHINSPRGNADYTLTEPVHYPFAFSTSPFLRWVSGQLVKAKPDFHNKTFLKPLHRTPEFCGTCHKVHLPAEVNGYKWLRGQDHYDAFMLSGVSGHGITSFYYPPAATETCAECHMGLLGAKDDFGAREFDDSGTLSVHDHLFPAANTGIGHMVGSPGWANAARAEMLTGSLRVDLFGLKTDGRIDGALTAPLRPEVPVLEPGRRYLLETVIRTLRLGHLFTQGTADSNEVWLDVTLSSAGSVIGRSGGLNAEGAVDPWSHFVNAYVLDREGNRIDRRNAQDIFVPLYNHQIPPGAADVVHYAFTVPPDIAGPLSVEVRLQYRKFDTTYLKYIRGERFAGNDLPVVTIAEDRIVLPVAGAGGVPANPPVQVAAWERWNDYGIGLLRKGSEGSAKGELRQAERVFAEVESLGRPDGPLNLARVYLKEGRLAEAAAALRRAAEHDPPAPSWSVAWFTAAVDKQNGSLDSAIAHLEAIAGTRFAQARARGFDFSRDYRVLNELGQTLVERAKLERGPARREARAAFLAAGADWFHRVLELDPENAMAHYNLAFVYGQLDDPEAAAEHRALYARYRPDDNARELAVAIHRRTHPAADHAAEAVVIYDLQRRGAHGLPSDPVYARAPGAEAAEGPAGTEAGL